MVNVQVIGRLAANSEIRKTKNGRDFLSFRMATDEYKNGKKETAWLNVVSYNDREFKMAQYLTKGKLISIFGTETVSIYTNKQGIPQISRDIIANSVEFVSVGQSSEQNEANKATDTTTTNTSNGSVAVNTEVPIPTCGVLKPVPKLELAQCEESEDDLPF